MIIEVKRPVFVINLDDPTQVSYITDSYNERTKTIICQTFNRGVPSKPKDNEILYKYTENRGYLYTLNS